MEFAPSLDTTNVFVKYLPPELNDAGLHSLFDSFGEIVSSKVMIDHQTGASLGYGFVRFMYPDDAQNAITSMTGTRVASKTLLCKLSNTSPNSTVPDPADNLYIKPLLPETSEDDLRELFERFGPINTCKVMIDKHTGKSRQIGFVRFDNLKDATHAMQVMNGFKLEEDSTPLVVKYAETDTQRANRKARQQQTWRAERPVSPSYPVNYFNFQQMQAALYNAVPYISPKGFHYMPITYATYSNYQQLPVNPVWRQPFSLNASTTPEIGQH